jgi:hypothetical protein
MITGFKLWLDTPEDGIGPVAVRVNATRGGQPGKIRLSISAQFKSTRGQTYSYSITVAIVETTVEGLRFTEIYGGCGANGCPVAAKASHAVPPGFTFLGMELKVFDSDRNPTPIYAAVSMPTNVHVDALGTVSSKIYCGTSHRSNGVETDISGACENVWIVIASRSNGLVGELSAVPASPSTPAGLPSPTLSSTTHWIIAPTSGVNVTNPASKVVTLDCISGARPARGVLEVLDGFYVFAGRLTSNAFQPAFGLFDELEIDGEVSATSSPSLYRVAYESGLRGRQTGSPLAAPATFLRTSTAVCLY